MGYDIHITRAKGFFRDNEQCQITDDEWLSYVKSDSELRLAGDNGAYFATWSGKSQHSEPWFDWSRGNIYTKNPDPPIIEKAIYIADKLGAKVQGDDGEVYLPNGKIEQGGTIVNKPGMDWRQWG